MVSRRRYKIDVVVLIIVLLVGGLATRNAQAIGDWWHERSYTPSSEIQQLATDAGMNDTGRKLFFRFSPELLDKQALIEHCGDKYGCAKGRNIYILRGDTPAEYNRSVVTAAHEMLHVAYARLSTTDRQAVDSLVQQQIDQSGETNGLLAEINIYKDTPDEYLNEAHSYLGSEYPDLSSGLEQHYSQYFSDRSLSTTAYKNSPEGH